MVSVDLLRCFSAAIRGIGLRGFDTHAVFQLRGQQIPRSVPQNCQLRPCTAPLTKLCSKYHASSVLQKQGFIRSRHRQQQNGRLDLLSHAPGDGANCCVGAHLKLRSRRSTHRWLISGSSAVCLHASSAQRPQAIGVSIDRSFWLQITSCSAIAAVRPP